MSGYILYGYPASGSGAVEVALVAANIPFEMKDLDPDAGELESEAFLAINPRGQVPTLIHPDGSVITEVPAILLHLADAHPGCGLAPQSGSSARAQHACTRCMLSDHSLARLAPLGRTAHGARTNWDATHAPRCAVLLRAAPIITRTLKISSKRRKKKTLQWRATVCNQANN